MNRRSRPVPLAPDLSTLLDEYPLGYAIAPEGLILPVVAWVGPDGECEASSASTCIVDDNGRYFVLDLETGDREPIQ